MLDTWKKPDNMTDDAFATVKKNQALVFDTVIGTASTGLKDYKGAQAAYKSLLALIPPTRSRTTIWACRTCRIPRPTLPTVTGSCRAPSRLRCPATRKLWRT